MVTTSFAWLQLLLFGLGLLAGLFLLILGLRGRRVGDRPYCRRCGYDLTGLSSDTCPECGLTNATKLAVYGRRKPVRLAVVSGLVLVIVLLPLLSFDIYRHVSGFNTLTLYPVSWLLNSAENGDRPSLNELVRRSTITPFSTQDAQRIAKVALKEQAAIPAKTDTQVWIDLLETIFQSGALTTEQEQQYYAQMPRLSFEVRPHLRVGENLPHRLYQGGAGPTSTKRGLRIYKRGYEIDGQSHGRDEGEWTSGQIDSLSSKGWAGSSIRLPDVEPGRHTMTLRIEARIYSGSIWGGDSAVQPPVVWSNELEFDAEFELLPADAPDTVTLVWDPNLAEVIQSTIKIEKITVEPGYKECTLQASGSVEFTTPPNSTIARPTGVAFEVQLISTAGIQSLGSVNALPNKTNHSHWVQAHEILPFEDEVVTIILETDIEAARNTTDLFEIWDGKLIYENVPVERKEQ